ncbi:inner membrane protein YhjD [Pseudonocardia eucalypti]|uniref:Inner membrane protein YhjD n=1 Tax=Pseudonocardia eucalypti TaxID=648755 RepID=A0ABP9PT96_9PSEU|nr:membrane protein [Pseudonocardia eucalypti]
MATGADKPEKPSKFAQPRTRYEWLDHLVRAGARYTDSHGDHYAAAITYFSVLALFPLLMVAFAAGALFLRRNPELVEQIKDAIKANAPGIGDTLAQVIDSALQSAGTVGVIGLLVALYSGLGWMTNLREALSEQWGQRIPPPTVIRKTISDLLALVGLGLALVIAAAVTATGGLAGQIVDWLGLGGISWLAPLIKLSAVVVGLLANALVFLWVLARLPREPVTWRSAAKAALAGAIGFEVIKQVMVYYLAGVTNSPTGALFGPILGLMVFIFTVSRFILFLTAWAATSRENEVLPPPPPPPPVVIRPEVTVRNGAGAADLLGVGAVAGLLGALLARRR